MGSNAGSANWQVRGGSFEQALANGQHLLDQHPEVALEQAQTLLRSGAEPRALRLAAAAFRRLGRAADAEAAELAAIQAGLKNSELEKAALAQEKGQSREAKAIAEDFLRRHPDDLLALTIAADAAIDLWDLDRAEEMLRTVLERAPTFLRASVLLAKCLMRAARARDAIAVLEEVLLRKPDNRPALIHMALLQAEVGDLEQAAAVDEKLLSLDENDRDRWIHHAHHLRILGRGDDAKNAFRRAIALDPGGGAAWWGLANYYLSDIDDRDRAAIQAAHADRAGTAADTGSLHLAEAILAEQRGDFQEAFKHFAAGKQLRLAAQPHDPDGVTAEVEDSIRIFTPNLYAERTEAGSFDPSPIFIIGIQRSGSTLVERILARHTSIEGAGELPIMPRMVERLRYRAGDGGNYASLVASMEPAELKELGRTYIERSRDFRYSEAPRFTDKLNYNWLHLGLIRLVLPNAKVIDVRRNALDCCWANFKMMFAEGHPAANDLQHLGLFYRDYVRLVDAIETARPGGVLQLRYEDLVDDIESATRRMLGFIGLDYEPDCIDFHLSTGAVATASSEQVRRPLNRQGIGTWRPYAPWLQPLREALGPLADD